MNLSKKQMDKLTIYIRRHFEFWLALSHKADEANKDKSPEIIKAFSNMEPREFAHALLQWFHCYPIATKQEIKYPLHGHVPISTLHGHVPISTLFLIEKVHCENSAEETIHFLSFQKSKKKSKIEYSRKATALETQVFSQTLAKYQKGEPLSEKEEASFGFQSFVANKKKDSKLIPHEMDMLFKDEQTKKNTQDIKGLREKIEQIVAQRIAPLENEVAKLKDENEKLKRKFKELREAKSLSKQSVSNLLPPADAGKIAATLLSPAPALPAIRAILIPSGKNTPLLPPSGIPSLSTKKADPTPQISQPSTPVKPAHTVSTPPSKTKTPEIATPHALPNIGNSCYMNSALQMLLKQDDFIPKVTLLKNTKIEGDVTSKVKIRKRLQAFIQAYQNHADVKKLSNALQELRDEIFHGDNTRYREPFFKGKKGEQQDAADFINLICDVIDYTPIDYQTVVTRTKSKPTKKSIKLPFLSIYSDPNSSKLQDLIDQEFAMTNTKVDDPTSEGTKIPAKRQNRIQNPPQQLMVRLTTANLKKKQLSSVKTLGLTIRPGDKIKIDDTTYILEGWIDHRSAMTTNGHYTFTGKYGEHWIECNDNTVGHAKTNHSNEAYILLFRKEVD